MLVVSFQCLQALTSVEKAVSKIKYIKSTNTSSLSDIHLKSIMTVSIKLEAQLDKLLLGKHQYHSSHCRCRSSTLTFT
jgi:hypothetical protein